MAYWDGGSGSGGKKPSDMRQLSPRKGQVTPESEEQVIEETEDVVRNFLFERYTEDLSNQSDDSSTETTPQIQEFMNFTSDPLSQASQVGRQLAIIGDDINRRYADEFSDMIQQLRITQDTAYDVFARVAKKIFAEGINWGRVAALLCFAYRIVIEVSKEKASQFGQFVKLIVHYVVRFIREKIVDWIVQRGGWSDALNYTLPSSVGFIAVGVCCLAAVAAVLYFKRGS
ncbi:bcl-2 homologous antagonist/killer-like [Mytilus trossulus]|uniref:bcl-2 homologous antagonist/killer-like n=1 Tax=Mytilus trossulus TaxID=6551 RepID=UPI0030064D35